MRDLRDRGEPVAEFKYALTRVCLRSGTLTLPGKMLDLFPDEGEFEAVDTTTEEVHELEIQGPRTIAGLGALFAAHDLHVNDQLVIRPLEEGRFAITPIRHERKPEWDRPEVVARFLDDLASEERPLTEGEIRAMYPYVPEHADLGALLASDGRFVRTEGRWRAPAPAAEDALEVQGAEPDAMAGAVAGGVSGESLHREEEADAPLQMPMTAATRAPSARAKLEGAGLNSEQTPVDMRAVKRTRGVLEHVGFRVEGLGHGQLMAVADLGRRSYKTLVHALPDGERLDWASLLARRRDTGARYLAVFGDHRDLTRLQSPAELARATLWSWAGVQRMLDLTRTVLISPVDLETHFERGGMFEHGLVRFEQGIAKRVEERGAFSAVLTKLATMRAPAIFLLEDLVVDVDLQRDQLLRILERLGEAPFHLVARIDSGEFCLRYRVSDALGQLSDYALSLRDRLPDRRRNRVVGIGYEDDDAVAEVPARGAPASSLAVPLFGEDPSLDR